MLRITTYSFAFVDFTRSRVAMYNHETDTLTWFAPPTSLWPGNTRKTVYIQKPSFTHRGPTGVFLAPELVGYSAPRDLHRRAAYSICESWFLIHQDVYHDLFVCS